MRRKNLFLSLSPNKRNYKVGIYEGSSIVIFGTVFIVAHRCLPARSRFGEGRGEDSGGGEKVQDVHPSPSQRPSEPAVILTFPHHKGEGDEIRNDQNNAQDYC